KNESEAELTITEGKYHQVKRMFVEVGNEVSYLKRLSIGSLKLDESLAPGEFRELSQVETDALFL
ncbi:MAG: rRNA pseudouridine synthase, partial [Treponema porcinum]|nr:rRNA pseudouridine synthase [Treponema porcinum]MDY5453810.1 rRNA pseudouridine synthase [Treponema porcinum]